MSSFLAMFRIYTLPISEKIWQHLQTYRFEKHVDLGFILEGLLGDIWATVSSKMKRSCDVH